MNIDLVEEDSPLFSTRATLDANSNSDEQSEKSATSASPTGQKLCTIRSDLSRLFFCIRTRVAAHSSVHLNRSNHTYQYCQTNT